MRRAKRAALSILAAVLTAGASPAAAYAPLGYPGAFWGSASRDFSGFEGYGLQSWIRQGVTWAKLPGDIPLETYGYYRWRSRGENRLYYDAHGPAVSVEISKAFASLGADFYWQNFPELHRQENHQEIFAGWYKTVDLARGSAPRSLGIPILGLPLSSWGRLSHDLSGVEGNSAQGWVQQGADVAKLPGKIRVTPFAAYRWRFRSMNRPYFNVHGPAAGVEFSGGHVQLGFEHAWRSYPELRRSERAYQAYLAWFYEWNLKPR